MTNKCPLCSFRHPRVPEVKKHMKYYHTMGQLIRKLLDDAGIKDDEEEQQEIRPR